MMETASEARGGSIMVMDDMQVKEPKQSWRMRLGRWIAGKPKNPPWVVSVGNVSGIREEYAMKEKASINELEGGVRFRIIPASNGQIIGYFPVQSNNENQALALNRITSRPNGERLYVLKEGEDLLGGIAACLALDRIKQS